MIESGVNSSSEYRDTLPTWGNAYLWPVLKEIIAQHNFYDRRAFDLGCGNGATVNMLSGLGFEVRELISPILALPWGAGVSRISSWM